MAITYNAGTNIIQIVGYTEGTPCNFTDIYNADVAGGWGVVTRQCTNQFCFNCKVVIGDGSTVTWFADTKKQILFTASSITANWQRLIKIFNNAHFRIGTLIDDSDKITKDGCTISKVDQAYAYVMIDVASAGALKIFNSHINGGLVSSSAQLASIETTVGSSPTFKMYNTVLNNVVFANFQAGTIFNVIQEDMQFCFSTVSLDIDKYTGTGATFEYIRNWAGTVNSTFKNMYMRGNPTYGIRTYQSNTNMYLIDCDMNKWTIYFSSAPHPTIYRQYGFDLKVVDKDNAAINAATVKIWDKDSNLIVDTTTNASGVIATQTITRGYYNQANGNTLQEATPHEMRIYKYGKSMLSSKSSIEVKTAWALTMLADTYITQTTEATVAAYTGITINHTAETITISSNHTLDEIYDYCQYDIIASTKQLDQTMHTADGVNLISEYSFVVNTGITVTATDQKLSMVSGETYTLTGTAQFTGVIVSTTATTTVNLQISLGTDDCYETDNTNILLDQTSVYVGYFTTCRDMGLRWQSVNIPPTAVITSAKLSLYLEYVAGTLSANVRGIDEDNTATWSSGSRPSQRTKTTATITANEANWNNWAVDSWIDIDITSVIQEIIDRGGWSANNDLAIVVEDTASSGTNYIKAHSYEHTGNLHGAKLDIEYEETTTRIPVKLTNIVDGSRYWVGKQSDGSEIFEGTQSGSGTVTGYYEHAANTDIDIRARKSSASVKYKPWIGEGTLIAEAFSLRIRQIQDSIVT